MCNAHNIMSPTARIYHWYYVNFGIFLKRVPAPIVHHDITIILYYFPPEVSSLRTSKQIVPSFLYSIQYDIFDQHTRIIHRQNEKKNEKLNNFVLYLHHILYEI